MRSQRLGTYDIVEEIGEGGMGMVYRGVDRQTGRPVAIKLLKSEVVASDPQIIERFDREGTALRQLNHPNIVKMLAIHQEGKNHYLVMEYLSGGSLEEILKKEQHLPTNRILEIALELADALTRAHHLKIIHRDLKPANILIADDGTPRLTDFGIAYISSQKHITQTGVAVGTPDYLSPEALDGKEIDVRSDIWAFGVLLFEMLAGKRPFEGDNLRGLITAILTKPVPDLEALRPDAPVGLVDLIYRMLEKDQNARIPSVRQVGAELEAILQGRAMSKETKPFDTPQPFGTPKPIVEERKLVNLPAQTTPFVGRDHELSELSKLLSDPNIRLITLLAPGGMGKTRIALEAAERQANHFSDGVVFVPLTQLHRSEDLVQAIAESIGYHFQGDGRSPRRQLIDYFRDKQMLLLMDNFEHLLEGAPLLSEILTAPEIKVIATSCERLSLNEETVLPVGGMNSLDTVGTENSAECDAVKLFLQSARRASPDFAPEPNGLKDILHICRLVEGLPLGILMAAAWVKILSLQEVANEIARSLGFLETDLRNIPDRHRSIRAVFDSSWKRLTAEEREVFAKLSVFRGGFTREAGQTVAGASLRTLGSLVDKSLLRREPDTGRFQIHELLRHYVKDRLDAADKAKSAYEFHAAYFADFMEKHWAPMTDRRQKVALREVKADIENARAAWRYWIQEGTVEEIRKFLRAFWVTYDIYGWYPAGIELLEQGSKALQDMTTDEAQAALGWISAAEGLYKVIVGLPREGFLLAEKSIKILKPLDRPEEMEMALISLFVTAGYVGQQEVSLQAANDCLRLATEIGDPWGIGKAKQWLALMAINQKDYDLAGRLANEALKICEERGDQWSESILSIEVLGLLAITLQQYDEAKEWIQRGIRAAQQIDFAYSLQTGYYQLGYVAALGGDLTEAGRLWQKAAQIGEGAARQSLFGFGGTSNKTWEGCQKDAHSH